MTPPKLYVAPIKTVFQRWTGEFCRGGIICAKIVCVSVRTLEGAFVDPGGTVGCSGYINQRDHLKLTPEVVLVVVGVSN